jgi:MoaA/NifB/PqqE/SkfB family radical SAM enzyme
MVINLKKLRLFKNLILVRYFNKRFPLYVELRLTNHCNFKCKYCDIFNRDKKELTTSQIFSLIDQIEDNCGFIILTGGEPLLREDIGKIIDYIQKKKGILLGLFSNGWLIKEKITLIRDVDILFLSIDGPPKIHDSLRNKGSFNRLIEAIDLAKSYNINVITNTVLTKYNVDCTDFIINLAKEKGIKASFEPVSYYSTLANKHVVEILPDKDKFNKFIKKLYNLRFAAQSDDSLDFYSSWPKFKEKHCFAGQSICVVEPNGDIYPCQGMIDLIKPLNYLEHGFNKSFNSLSVPKCAGCWCGIINELNSFFSLSVNSIFNNFFLFRKKR